MRGTGIQPRATCNRFPTSLARSARQPVCGPQATAGCVGLQHDAVADRLDERRTRAFRILTEARLMLIDQHQEALLHLGREPCHDTRFGFSLRLSQRAGQATIHPYILPRYVTRVG